MRKHIREGKVAVLYVGKIGSGHGWYTTNKIIEAIYDPDIVQMILDQQYYKIADFARWRYGERFITTSAEQLQIQWIALGTRFTILRLSDHGREQIITEDDLQFVG